MPIIEYQCPSCHKLRDELRSLSENMKISRSKCLICDVDMVQIMSATAGKVKGSSTPVKYKSKS